MGIINNTYLNSTLGEGDPLSYLLPEENVRIVRSVETLFQLAQLSRREPRPMSLLFHRLVIALYDSRRVP